MSEAMMTFISIVVASVFTWFAIDFVMYLTHPMNRLIFER